MERNKFDIIATAWPGYPSEKALRVQNHGRRHLISARYNAFDSPIRNSLPNASYLEYPGLWNQLIKLRQQI